MLGQFDFSLLPPLNAALNATSATLLAVGFVCIRAGRRRAHAALMLTAFVVSITFLASYITYHFVHLHVVYGGHGVARTIYLTILLSHMILAVTVPPMAIMAIRRALRREFDRHKRITRFLLPIWFYVSVTGIVIYLMLRPYYPL